MTIAILHAPDLRLEVDLFPIADLSEADFVALCQANPELRFERGAKGEILIMPPEGGESGHRGQTVGVALALWAERDGRGTTFGSSTGFRLPDGATRSPDAAWVRYSRLAALTPEQRRQFLPLCPDFVIEVRSPSDRLDDLHAKMVEYMANGAELGWLIDPDTRTVHIYRPNEPIDVHEQPTSISGDPELPGFVLPLQGVWVPRFEP